MIERPIIFSAPIVRAILAGQKTQTRRLLHYHRDWPGAVKLIGGQLFYYPTDPSAPPMQPCMMSECRYEPGMRLWVRETAYIAPPGFSDEPIVNNTTDSESRPRVVGYVASMDEDSIRCAEDYHVKRSPPIFLPRWASRISLDVNAVRIERLQDISEEDARAEGVTDDDVCRVYRVPAARDAFAYLWDDINGKRAAWATNPWVAVVTFKRVTP